MRVHEAKTRYRASRHALLALRSSGSWQHALKDLRDDDVRALNERSMTEQEREQREHQVRTGTQVADDAREGVFIPGIRGEGKHTVSWIWMTVSSDDNSPEMIEGEYISTQHCMHRSPFVLKLSAWNGPNAKLGLPAGTRISSFSKRRCGV